MHSQNQAEERSPSEDGHNLYLEIQNYAGNAPDKTQSSSWEIGRVFPRVKVKKEGAVYINTVTVDKEWLFLRHCSGYFKKTQVQTIPYQR